MEDFRSYSPEDVITANLRETAERMSVICEQETAHLCEQAAQIVADGAHSSDFIASLPDHRPTQFVCPSLPENADTIRKATALWSVWQSVVLCREIRRRLESEEALLSALFFPDSDTLAQTARGRVIYQRSSYADSAYLHFTSQIREARAVYTHSFSAVCEEVSHGNCEYCILPIENSAEGTLNSFARLIDRYELKIAATCDIPTTDAGRITRFALLRRNILPPASFDAKDLFFEFTAPLIHSPGVAALLSAAECCGLSLCRFDSRLRQAGEESSSVAHIVLQTGEGDLASFLLYLAMEAPQCDRVGIYFHIKDNQQKGR
jgi:prephenate dehydratase